MICRKHLHTRFSKYIKLHIYIISLKYYANKDVKKTIIILIILISLLTFKLTIYDKMWNAAHL